MDLWPTHLVPAASDSVLRENACGLVERGGHESEFMLVPGHVTNIREVALDSQRCMPLRRTVICLIAFPLVHGATVGVSEDVVNIVKVHRTEEGVFISNHCTKGGLDGPGLSLGVGLPQAHIEIEGA